MSLSEAKIQSYSGKVIIIDLDSNVFYQHAPDLFLEMCDVLNTKPKWATNIITHSKKHIYEWIRREVQQYLLDESIYSANTLIYWVLNGIVDWSNDLVRCKYENCNKPLIGKNVRSIFDGYYRYCSRKCSALSEQTQEKHMSTCRALYGVDHWMSDPRNVKKVQDRFEETYGEGKRSPMQVDEFKHNFEQSMIRAHGGKYSYSCADIMAKIQSTNLKNYGSIHPSQTDTVKQRSKDTFIHHYGVDNNMKSEQGFADYIKGVKQKHGISEDVDLKSISQIPEVAQKISKSLKDMSQEKKEAKQLKYEKTCKDRYGVSNMLNSKASLDSMMKKYGKAYPAQVHSIAKKMKRRYQFNDINFDSAPEIAFYIWLSDNNIKFIYQPEVSFTYEFEGQEHLYFPDFLLEDDHKFIEIKGDHFFKDGKMICPFRKKSWTDEKYEKVCEKYEAKHQCMLANNVQIYTHTDYAKYLEFVDQKYGKDFISSLRKIPVPSII